jgi:hypothetical protein
MGNQRFGDFSFFSSNVNLPLTSSRIVDIDSLLVVAQYLLAD